MWSFGGKKTLRIFELQEFLHWFSFVWANISLIFWSCCTLDGVFYFYSLWCPWGYQRGPALEGPRYSQSTGNNPLMGSANKSLLLELWQQDPCLAAPGYQCDSVCAHQWWWHGTVHTLPYAGICGAETWPGPQACMYQHIQMFWQYVKEISILAFPWSFIHQFLELAYPSLNG